MTGTALRNTLIQPRWSGVAILSRVVEFHKTQRGPPCHPDDDQSCYIEAAVTAG